MIHRIVKMTFRQEEIHNFKELFQEVYPKISTFEGCKGVELLQDVNHPNVFFTYSFWESEAHLNKYRYSELFKATWERTKAKFAEKAEAWSLERVS